MNPITQLANDTGSWAIAESENIMAGPIGYVIYFTVGLSLLGVVIFSIKKWF